MNRISDQLVCHDRFNMVRDEIIAALARARACDPQIVPVIGPTRVGKSKLLESVIRANASTSPVCAREIVSILSPKHLTGRALPDACLLSIGLSPAMFRNHVSATDAFIKAVNKHATRLIIFDETQHMLERGSATTVRAAADFLKGVFDQTQASLVLVGLPTLGGLFQANEQLADRSRRAVEFFPYGWEGLDYKKFRSALAGALEFLSETGWQTFAGNDSDFARRMYVASAGRYGLINKLFMEVQATQHVQKTAGYDAFSQAYTQALMGRLVEFDPFDQAHTIQTEHMALVYAKVMQEAGVRV